MSAALGCGGGDSPAGPPEEPPPSTVTVTLTLLDGDRQQAPTGATVLVAPVVEARTSAGQPVSGVPLSCTIAAGGGQITASAVTTDANGRASCAGWTLGAVGDQQLRVITTGTRYVAASPVTVRATAVASGGASCGPPRSYPVAATSATALTDSVTGLRFVFPSGGQGTLEVARAQPLASEPAESLTRFAASFSGAQPVEVALPLNGGEPAAYFYGEMTGVATSGPGGARWWALPIARVRNDTAFIVLSVPPASLQQIAATFTRTGLSRFGTSAVTVPTRTAQMYAAAVIPPTSPTATVRRNFRLSVEQLIDWWKTTLSPANSARLAAGIAADPWNFSTGSSGDSYYAKGWVTTYNLPWIYYNTNRDLVTTARHEGSHYVTHMLLGDARYREIEAYVPPSGHDLGLVASGFRESLIEEYAHLASFLMTGALDSHDLRSLAPVNNVRDLMLPHTPRTADFPSLEGFGAAMMAALTRTGSDTLVYDHFTSGSRTRSPAKGVAHRALFDALATGPRTPNELREALVPLAGGEATLAAVLEPIGWSYQAFGRVVNEQGLPVPEAVVAAVVQASDGKSYRTVGSTPAGANGKIWLPRLYPGTSTLRVYTPKSGGGLDSADVGTVTVPWTQSTRDSVDLKDLVLPRLNAFNGIVLDVSGISAPNLAGSDACRPNFSVNDMLANNTVYATFPLVWNGLSFSTSGSTTWDVPPAYSGARLTRYTLTMSATGTLSMGKGDTLLATVTGASTYKSSKYLVDVVTQLGRWVTAVNTTATFTLQGVPVLMGGSTIRGILTGAPAVAALSGWDFSHFWIDPDIPTFHPQDCRSYTLGPSTRVEVMLVKR